MTGEYMCQVLGKDWTVGTRFNDGRESGGESFKTVKQTKKGRKPQFGFTAHPYTLR